MHLLHSQYVNILFMSIITASVRSVLDIWTSYSNRVHLDINSTFNFVDKHHWCSVCQHDMLSTMKTHCQLYHYLLKHFHNSRYDSRMTPDRESRIELTSWTYVYQVLIKRIVLQKVILKFSYRHKTEKSCVLSIWLIAHTSSLLPGLLNRGFPWNGFIKLLS